MYSVALSSLDGALCYYEFINIMPQRNFLKTLFPLYKKKCFIRIQEHNYFLPLYLLQKSVKSTLLHDILIYVL